jgi:hypothetical protein
MLSLCIIPEFLHYDKSTEGGKGAGFDTLVHRQFNGGGAGFNTLVHHQFMNPSCLATERSSTARS